MPAASFAEYTWGRPLDEPLRPLTDAPYAVRDAVPLTPANTIRFLDAIEQRLQSPHGFLAEELEVRIRRIFRGDEHDFGGFRQG